MSLRYRKTIGFNLDGVYLQNQESVNQYIENWLNWSHQQREEQRLHPSPIVQKLKQYKAEKLKQLQENVH